MGGKSKKQRLAALPSKKSHSQKHPAPPPQSQSKKSKPIQHQQQHTNPIVPFTPESKTLLIGEGDLSFARSLLEHHDCKNVMATVLEDDAEELEAKYPQVKENIEKIEELGGKILFAVDAGKMGKWAKSIKAERWDRICFNFPHVGGKSTDVNRQVRYNQELLVSFFKKSLPHLAPAGSIIVTLFEGEPYTLWNIRDLARHAGFQVERSFKFQAGVYPGYHHARTLGVVKSKTGEASAGWKGEDRPARSYLFVRKGEQQVILTSKRKRNDDSSDEGGDD